MVVTSELRRVEFPNPTPKVGDRICWPAGGGKFGKVVADDVLLNGEPALDVVFEGDHANRKVYVTSVIPEDRAGGLSTEDFHTLCDTLTWCYPAKGSLDAFLIQNFGATLGAITKDGSKIEVVWWAINRGKVPDLIAALTNEDKTPKFRALAAKYPVKGRVLEAADENILHRELCIANFKPVVGPRRLRGRSSGLAEWCQVDVCLSGHQVDPRSEQDPVDDPFAYRSEPQQWFIPGPSRSRPQVPLPHRPRLKNERATCLPV